MRRPVAQRLPDGDALGVEGIGDSAHGGLRALLVDVPALEMLERRGVHDDQRRMDDRAGVHQGARERVAAWLDHAGKGSADDRECVVGEAHGQDPGRQPLGADGDGRLEGPVLAREPRQRPGLGEGDVGAVAGIACSQREYHRAERAGREENDLTVGQMRRQRPGDVGLRGRGRGT